MTSQDAHNQVEIQERTSLLIPRVEYLFKCLLLRSLYKSEVKEIKSILAEVTEIKRLAHA